MQIIEEHDLIRSLTEMISMYMSRNSQLTLNALAARSNVPVTTLRRLMSGQQKNEVAPHSVLNIVSYVLREKNLSTILEKAEPSIADFLRKHFGNFVFATGGTHSYDCDLNIELKDESKYLIYKLAANHSGTDFMTIVENFGAHGKKKADEMIKDGLLKEEEGRLHAREKNFSLDLSIAAQHLPALVQFYKPTTIAQGRNSMFSMSESLNEIAIAEIKKIQRECVQKIHSIMNDSDYFGHIPYFTINLSETMLSETHPGDLQ